MSMTMTKPPTVFWIISIIALLWNLMGAGATVGQLMITDEMINLMDPKAKALYETTPKWTHFLNAAAVLTGLLGAILLLVRKKSATTLFLISLILVIVYMAYFLLFTKVLEVNGLAGGLIMPILVIAIAGFLLYYARKSARLHWIS